MGASAMSDEMWSKVVMGIPPHVFRKSGEGVAIARVSWVSENGNGQTSATKGVAATLLRHSGEVKKSQGSGNGRGGDGKHGER